MPAVTESPPAYRPTTAYHPDWTLRASFSGPHRGHTRPKIHLFDGVTAACGRRPDSSAWVHSELIFHPPATTKPTCYNCQNWGRFPGNGASPLVRGQATSRMVTYALATQDPHVLTVAMRLLCAHPSVEPVAELLASVASLTFIPTALEGTTS